MKSRVSGKLSALALGVAATMLASAATASAQSAAYDYVKVAFPGATYTNATGINNAGQVVGSYVGADGIIHGYTFDGAAYATVDYPGASESLLFGIGPGGEVVGTYGNSAQNMWSGFSRTAQGFSAAQFPTNRSTDLRGFNASGQIVGSWDNGGATPGPANGLTLTNGQFSSLNVPWTALGTVASGINDSGAIAGTYFDAQNRVRGFGNISGSFTAIDFPGAAQTGVGTLNNQRRIAGWSLQANKWRGFTLADQAFRTLEVTFAGATQTIASSVNDLNQVAGSYTGPDCPSWCGFVATPKVVSVPTCSQKLTMSYAGSTVKMKFTGLQTALPLTWTGVLLLQNTQYTLWSATLAAQASPVSVEYPVTNVPHLGVATGLSLLTRADGVTVCADVAYVDTGI